MREHPLVGSRWASLRTATVYLLAACLIITALIALASTASGCTPSSHQSAATSHSSVQHLLSRQRWNIEIHSHQGSADGAPGAAATPGQASFEDIYAREEWGPDGNGSGVGSSQRAATWAAAALLGVFQLKHIRTMVDAACGGMVWMPAALRAYGQQQPDFRYLGLDVVRPIIANATDRFADEPQWTFAVQDFTMDALPQADLLFCRDALQHLPVKEVVMALENFAKSGATWIMLGSYMRQTLPNVDIHRGDYTQIDLQTAPFSLDAPAMVFDENSLIAGGGAEHGQKHLLLYEGSYLRSIDFEGMRERARALHGAGAA